MDAFNEAKKIRELPSPVIELSYPIACFFPNAGMLDLSDLPAHTQFQIMDLPGKRNQDDKINSAVIENCRRALSIVTYNMEQTDEKLRQSLMEEVLGQVKLMGGSPARMLFALNRIDVFRKDQDWERREQETAEQTIKEIKAILHDRLPEHRHVLEYLSYSKLSSLPALLAWQMKTSEGEQRVSAAEQVDDHFKSMIPRRIKANLSNASLYHWEDHDFQQVQNSVWDSSYAKDFFPMLEKHIRENFAKLIVAPLLVEFEGVVSHIIGQADRTCMVEVESSNRQLAEIEEQLKNDHTTITDVLAKYHKDLMSLPKFIEKSPNILENFDNQELNPEIFGDSIIYNNEHIQRNILPAFPQSIVEPINSLTGISEGVTQSLKSGHITFTGTAADELHHKDKRSLELTCRNLILSGYDIETAKNGKKIKAAWDGEKQELQELLNIIESYASDIYMLMQEIYEKKVERENQRIQELMEEIVKTFIANLNSFLESLGLMLKPRFDQKIFNNIKLEVPSIEFAIDLDKETKIERNPWLLWLSKRDVSYTNIPSADQLHSLIIGHLQSVKKQATKPLQNAISKYYKEIDIKMKDYINGIMDDVEAKLEASYKENETKHKDQEETWLVLREFVALWEFPWKPQHVVL